MRSPGPGRRFRRPQHPRRGPRMKRRTPACPHPVRRLAHPQTETTMSGSSSLRRPRPCSRLQTPLAWYGALTKGLRGASAMVVVLCFADVRCLLPMVAFVVRLRAATVTSTSTAPRRPFSSSLCSLASLFTRETSSRRSSWRRRSGDGGGGAPHGMRARILTAA